VLAVSSVRVDLARLNFVYSDVQAVGVSSVNESGGLV
jgi:hypothetical protein